MAQISCLSVSAYVRASVGVSVGCMSGICQCTSDRPYISVSVGSLSWHHGVSLAVTVGLSVTKSLGASVGVSVRASVGVSFGPTVQTAIDLNWIVYSFTFLVCWSHSQ